MKNTGRPSEDTFDAHFAHLGKRAYVHVFTDAAEVNGRNRGANRRIAVKAQPADRLVVCDGKMFLAEVKSSTSQYDRFDFKLLRTTQSAEARMAIAAGGEYWIYYHHILTDEWFRFPYTLVAAAKADGASSIPLDFLRRSKNLWIPE